MTLLMHTGVVLGLLIVYSIFGAIVIQLLEGGSTQPDDKDTDNDDVTNINNNTKAPIIDEKQLSLIRDDVMKSVVAATNALILTATPKEVPAKGKDAAKTKDLPNPALMSIKSKIPELLKKELKKYESSLQDLITEHDKSETTVGQDEAEEDSKPEEDPWSFFGSLFYCTTIYTTIGYGAVSPVTDAGRVFTIIYALIGIPLCLIVLDDLGKLLTRGLKKAWSFAFRTYNVDENFNFLAPVALAITLMYILAGADMYRQWEDWGYIQSIYFIFITVSTVGFGDILPTCPGLFLLSYIYVLVGLALAGMTINVLMESIGRNVDILQHKIMTRGIKPKVE